MKSKKISDVCDVIGGFAFQSSAMKSDNGEYQVVKMSNLYKGSLDLDRNPSFLDEIEPRHKQYLLQKGDVLMTLTGTIGKKDYGYSVQVEKQKNLLLNQRVCLLRPRAGKVNGYYLLQLLRSKDFLDQFFESSIGGTGNQSNVSITILKDMIIGLPDIEGQTAIASLLSTWDIAIEMTERLVAAKEKRYSCLSSMLLFGNINSSTDASKKTRWFAVPDHWNIVKIGSVAKEVKATNDSGESIPVLSCTKYEGLVNSLEYFGKQVFSLDTSTYKVVSRGQFAYATNHIEEGSIGYQNLHDKGLVSPMYTVFETGKSIDDGYLYKVLKTETYRHIFQVNTSASVDRRGSLRWNEFAKLPIPLPPIDEQQKISAILNTARQEIDLLKKQADAFRKQKRGLMQKLLTGEWRVRVGGDENGHSTD